MDDGLASNRVLSVMQDSSGFMWFGTLNGISRFDGQQFISYFNQKALDAKKGTYRMLQDRQGRLWFCIQDGLARLENGEWRVFTSRDGLAGNYGMLLFEDRRGWIWFGTQEGLNCYNNREWRSYSIRDGLADDTVREILETASGDLISVSSHGLSLFDSLKLSWKHWLVEDSLGIKTIYTIKLDHQGNLWLGTDDGLRVNDGKRWKSFTPSNSPVPQAVGVLYVGREGNLWLGGHNEVIEYNGRNWRVHSLDEQKIHILHPVYQDVSGRLWISDKSDRGAYILDNGRFTRMDRNNGMLEGAIWDIKGDRDGNVWFAVYNQGVSLLPRNPFSIFRGEQYLGGNMVFDCLIDSRQDIWIGTDLWLSRYDGKRWKSYKREDGVPSPLVYCLAEDSSGGIWCGTDSGAARFDGKKWTNAQIDPILRKQSVKTILTDRRGVVWIGTEKGLTEYDGSSGRSYTTEDGLPGNLVISLCETPSGELWVGTTEGAARFNGRRFEPFGKPQGLVSDYINDIFADSSGNIWFGTENGICRYDGRRIDTLTTADGLSSNTCYFINRIGREMLFGTMTGLNRYDGKQFRFYGQEEGLAGSDLNRGASAVDRKGRLWFGSTEGLTVFDPSNELVSRNGPRVYITRASLIGPDSSFSEGAVLKHFENDLRFDFVGLDFSSPEKVVYSYRLDSFDGEWKETRLSSVNFVNVPSGRHVFEVVARNGHGLESPAPARFAFTIKPAFFQTAVFKLLLLLTLTAIVLLFVRYWHKRKVTQELRAKNIQLEREIAERERIGDELRESEQHLSDIVDFLPDATFAIDLEGKVILWNRAVEEMTGVRAEDILSKGNYEYALPFYGIRRPILVDLVLKWDDENARNYQHVRIDSGNVILAEIDTTILGKDLTLFGKAKPLSSTKGEIIGAIESVRDISDRKRAEKKLQEERQRLASIIEGTHVGTWEWNVQTGETVFNERWADIFGYRLEELLPVSIKTWEHFTHPDDLRNTNNVLQKHFKGDSDFYEVEFRMRHKDGHWVWVLDRGKVTSWTEDGKPLLMQGTHTDITERKRAEDAILEKAALLEAQVNATIDGILVVDENRKRLLINQRMIELFDVPQYCLDSEDDNVLLEYVAGKAKHPDEFIARILYLFEHKNETCLDEIEFQNGMRLDRYSAPVLGQEGNYYGRIWTFRDITERKQAEEAILKRLTYERLLSQISSSAVKVDDLQTFLQECMALIGEIIAVSRTYIFEYHQATETSSNTIEWCSEGTSSQKDALQNIPNSVSPWGFEMLRNGNSLSYSDIEDIPDTSLKDFLRFYGSKSLLVVPLFIRGNYYGFMGFDECNRKRIWPDEDIELLLSISRIITGAIERKQASMEIMANMQRTEALLQLGRMTDVALKEITDFALEKAIEITGSQIGYLAFVNEDESILTINSWSKSALEECAVVDRPIIYPLVETGLWGEAVRQRKPIITNDYSAENAWKKGLPKGHVSLLRHMNTPIFDNSRIVLVAGVGNKEEDYSENDCQQLTLLMQGMWHLIEHKRTEDALRLTQFATDKASEHVMWGDADGNIIYANDSACESLGYTRDEFLKLNVQDIDPGFSPEDLKRHVEELTRLGSMTFESRHRAKDGRIFPVEIRANYCDNKGQFMSCAFDHDISERKRAEQQLRESEEKFRLISEQSLMAIFILQDDRILYANQAAADQTGYKVEELLKLGPGEFAFTIHPDDRQFVQRQKSIKQGGREGATARFFFRGVRKNGATLWLDQYSRTILYEGRTADLIVRADITEIKNAERALRESEERFRMIIEASKDGMIAVNRQGLIKIFNPAAEKIFGRTSSEMLDQPLDLLMPQNMREEHRRYVESFFERGEPDRAIDRTLQLKGLHGDGTEFDIELSLSKGAADGKEFVLAVIRDITDKLTLEANLLQSRKMETIGQLAGGVAHDFNNMLSVIIGHTEVALGQVDPEQELHFVLMEILTAAERSADLTHQLLAFARKQTISPRVLNLNKTVAGTLGMLRRLIGEAIELNWLPGDDLFPIRMDPSQIDQVLTNLCINARDAIAGVGKISISTGAVVIDEADCAGNPGFLPGRYVLLAVSDSGRGMDRETLDRVFEPFFTTKERGKGTGLGLATVYGIVKQNDGFINVYSEPEKGTIFKIYLPGHDEPEERVSNVEPNQYKAASGNETVLLVEDEPSILVLATTMLEHQGYKVLSASSPNDAIGLANEYKGKIDLLLTDVVMPEMNGRDLAKELLTLCPDIRQLFMSGYTADVIAHHGVLEDGVHFLQKPFTARTLLEKVRLVLDSV
ncbi:PAS domain S-box protein [bacterium]|nr:PAS domain S-box protein [bacterium]